MSKTTQSHGLIAHRTAGDDPVPRRPLPIALVMFCMFGALNVACVVVTLVHA